MKKIKGMALIFLLTAVACHAHHKGVVEVTFNNGDKDTLYIKWDDDLELSGRGCLSGPYLGEPCFVSNVRTYKILKQ